MSERDAERDGSFDRRTFMKGALASSLVGTGVGTTAAADSGSQFVLEQGDTEIPLTPLSYEGQSIEEFYGFGNHGHAHANTPTNVARSDVSRLFLWDGPKGLSLVMLHDAPHNGTGGELTFEFAGLPDSGVWAVGDDDPGNDTYFGNSRVDWQWNQNNTDGGAYRGLDAAGVPFAEDLEIRTEDGYRTSLSNEWHYKERFDQGLEGFDGPVWVFVFSDNADFDSQPSGELERPFSVENGELVLQGGSETEPTNDVYFVLKPGIDGSALKFVGERAGKNNTILFDGETLISNTNNASPGQTFSLPGASDVNVTVTPDWQSGISRWEALSEDASSPTTHTLDMSQPVTIRSSDSSSSPDNPLSSLVDQKSGLIEDIRAGAGTYFSEGAVDDLDATAESLLGQIKEAATDADDETVSQLEEALERMIAAEDATLSATNGPKGLVEDTVNGAINAAFIAVTEGILPFKGGLGIKSKIIKAVIDFLGDAARKFVDFAGSIGRASRGNTDEVASTIRTFQGRIDDLFTNNPKAVNVAAKHAGKGLSSDGGGSYEGSLSDDVPDDAEGSVVDPVMDIRRELIETANELVYQLYYTGVDFDDVKLPSLSDIEGEVNDLSVDLPNVPFVDWPEMPTVDLPEVAEFADVRSLDGELGSGDLVPGVDPAIESAMADLEDRVDARNVSQADPQDREFLRNVATGAIEGTADVAEAINDFVKDVVSLINDIEFLVGLGIVVAGIATVLTAGLGSAVLGVLVTAAFYLAAASAVLSLLQSVVGVGSLLAMGKTHELGANAIAQGVELGGDN